VVSLEQIEELARDIGREFQPTRVVLFGSHAYGKPTGDSDVDILVVIPHEGKSWRMASRIRDRVHPKFPVDLVVRTPEQVRHRLALGDCFFEEIVTRGKVLYESSDR
jgi:predicted nucleotidyltransferase